MQIGALEFIATIGCVGLIPLVLTIPTFTAQAHGTGAMAHTLYIIFTNAIFLMTLFKLFFQFPQKDMVDIAEYVGGKFLKYLTIFLIIGYLLFSTTLVLAEFEENINNILFQNAPSKVIYVIFLIGLTVGVLNGLKGVFRAATLITPLIMLSLLLLFFSLHSEIDITNYTPILGNSSTSFWKDPLRIELYEGILVILLLGTHLKNPKKAALWSYLLTSLIILLITTLLFGIIPYPSIKDNYFPFFELSRLMSFGRFWQRVESIYTLIWLMAVYVYISIGPSYTILVLSEEFGLHYSYRYAPLICFLVINSSILFKSYTSIISTRKFLNQHITPYLVLCYPIVILIIAMIKKRRNPLAHHK